MKLTKTEILLDTDSTFAKATAGQDGGQDDAAGTDFLTRWVEKDIVLSINRKDYEHFIYRIVF